MFKGKNKISIAEEILIVNKWSGIIPENGKTKFFINNWITPFLTTIKIHSKEKIQKILLYTYWASSKNLQKMLLICKDLKVIGANNLLLANRSKSEWIKNNVAIKLTDNHSKVVLIKTEKNWYVIAGSGNFRKNKNKLEHLTITNCKKLYQKVENHFNNLYDGSSKGK